MEGIKVQSIDNNAVFVGMVDKVGSFLAGTSLLPKDAVPVPLYQNIRIYKGFCTEKCACSIEIVTPKSLKSASYLECALGQIGDYFDFDGEPEMIEKYCIVNSSLVDDKVTCTSMPLVKQVIERGSSFDGA